jgi:hypothetical protein
MLRLILTTYLAFMTSAGPAVCCCLAARRLSIPCQSEKCAAEKGCCSQAPGGCAKLPRRTTPCPCPNTTGGCCLQTPTIVAKNDVRGDLILLLSGLPALHQVADVAPPSLAACSAVAVSEPFWPASDLLHVHHRLRC